MKKAILGEYYARGKGYHNLGVKLIRSEYSDSWVLLVYLYKISFERHIKDSYGKQLAYGFCWDLNDRVIRFYFGTKAKSFCYLQKQLHKNDYYTSKIKKLFNIK